MNHPRDISGPWIEVDLAAMDHNIQQIHAWANRPLWPVIKGNAYGHGVVEVGRRLDKIDCIQGLTVGVCNEAFLVREAGIARPILNLGPFTRAEAERIVSLGISQSVFNRSVRLLDEAAAARRTKAKVHIKIDTGLGRVGVLYDQADDFIDQVAALGHVTIEGVFTSLSEDPELDARQLKRLKNIVARAKDRGLDLGVTHAASSDAVLANPDSFLDAVRPGIMVFGHYPNAAEYEKRRIDLKPALTLKTRVTCTKTLKAGLSVGYHQAYTALKDQDFITGGIGYPDGYPIQAANRTECLINGRRHPLVAAVTANHIYVRSNGGPIEPGDEIVLYGRQGEACIPVEEVARLVDRSEYNLLARLSSALPRFYFG